MDGLNLFFDKLIARAKSEKEMGFQLNPVTWSDIFGIVQETRREIAGSKTVRVYYLKTSTRGCISMSLDRSTPEKVQESYNRTDPGGVSIVLEKDVLSSDWYNERKPLMVGDIHNYQLPQE